MLESDKILKRYWDAYGGFKSLLSSMYFYTSLVLTLLLYPHWTQVGWWDSVISIMPNLLGFTLGGFAMWVAIGDEHFKATISGTKTNEASPFMVVNATFAHFIFLQIISILLALINKAYNISLPESHILVVTFGDKLHMATILFYFVSYFFFIYALISALASVIALFRVSSWYDDYQSQGLGAKIKEMLELEERTEQLRKIKEELENKLNSEPKPKDD